MRTRLLIIIGLIIFSFITPQSFGVPDTQGIRIELTLNQETYKTGETIKLSANVGVKESDSLATVTLLKPDETIVTSIQIMPNDEGIVSYHFKAGSGNMNVSGQYTIKFQHDGGTVLKLFSFNVIEDRTGISISVDNDPPFFGIFVYMDNLFSWIMGK